MLERRINATLQRALEESSRAQYLCLTLRDRRFAVSVNGTPWILVFHSSGESLTCSINDGAQAPSCDAGIAGSPLALVSLLGREQRELIRQGVVEIRGDGEVAQKFSELLQLLRPDFEHELGQFTGPITAHLLARGAESVWSQGRSLLQGNLRNASDYLAFERRTLVPMGEAEHQFSGIDSARARIDRLQARLTQLEQAQ
jgi:ubiquinone biosynthesis protein UbiJ